MKILKNIILLNLIILLLSSCLKKEANEELKTQQILSYIDDLQLDFDTLKSGILLHKTYNGIGQRYSIGDVIEISFTGIYLDPNNGENNGYFAQDDTFKFVIGNNEILNGWNEIPRLFSKGGVGIAIFPFNKAYGNDQTPNIPSNCSLVYYFRILSDNYRLNQTSLFWSYAEQYNSTMNIFDDTLIYVKHYEGLGNIVNSGGTLIDYQLFTIEDSLVDESYSYYVDFSDASLPPGLIEAVSLMNEGEMGKIIVPPSLAYTAINNYNLRPYSALYYETRAISADHEIEEKSKINKYLYTHNATPDSIFSGGILYFKNKTGSGIHPLLNTTIEVSDSLYFINHDSPVRSCQNCTKMYNSTNYTSGQIKAIHTLLVGGEGTFVIPYSEMYGGTTNGSIPPYSTLIYKVKLISN